MRLLLSEMLRFRRLRFRLRLNSLEHLLDSRVLVVLVVHLVKQWRRMLVLSQALARVLVVMLVRLSVQVLVRLVIAMDMPPRMWRVAMLLRALFRAVLLVVLFRAMLLRRVLVRKTSLIVKISRLRIVQRVVRAQQKLLSGMLRLKRLVVYRLAMWSAVVVVLVPKLLLALVSVVPVRLVVQDVPQTMILVLVHMLSLIHI